MTEPKFVRRYVRHDEQPDRYTCDVVWTDRKTGREVLSYDGGDPASTNPAYGGKSDADRFKKTGLDIFAEIPAEDSKLPVEPGEVERCTAARAAREQREREEAEAVDLLDFLGADAATFVFEEWEEGEDQILRPALERRGFTDISFSMGEQDSFGPLSRWCVAIDGDGKRRRFIYG